MDNLQTTLDQLRQDLTSSRRSVWVYAMVGPKEEHTSRLLAFDAIVGPKPPGWSERLWEYEQCTFVSTKITSKRLAVWCEGGPQEVRLGPVRTTLDLREGSQHTVIHSPSLAQYGDRELDWPAFVHTPSLTDAGHVNGPQGYLIGAGSTPSFPDFGGAFSAFFHNQYAITGVRHPQLNSVHVRIVDNRARIRRVQIGAASIDVRLAGSNLKSTMLELNGAEYRTVVPLESSRVVIPLPNGLPSDAWLWLKCGSEWVDFRALTGWGGTVSRDVEHDLPHDPAADLSHLLTRGEGQFLEYKEKLPASRDEARNIFKTVVAFANGAGGTVVFGVEDETQRVKGITGQPSVERHRLTDLVRDLVRPSPPVSIEAVKSDGQNLLLLRVGASGGTIHALVLDGNKPEYYVRREATTYYARPEELEAIAEHKPRS